MVEENEESVIEASLITDFAQITLTVKSVKDIIEKEKELFRIADLFDRMNSILNLRRKYSILYTIFPERLLIQYNSANWVVWEKVLLILLNSYNFISQRSEIWKFDIRQGTLRNIIRDKTNFIEPIDDDRIKLTPEGLKYIINKLNENMKNYDIEIGSNDNNE